MYHSVVDFLTILDTTFIDQDEAIKALEISLNQLALALHFITYSFETDWSDPSRPRLQSIPQTGSTAISIFWRIQYTRNNY